MKNYSEWYFEKRNKDLLHEKLLGVIIRKKKQRFTLWKITRSDNSKQRNKDLLYEKLLGVIIRKKKQRFTFGKITRSDNSKKETKIYFMKNYSQW